MFGGVKITLILCATMIVCCVLFISYNEYTNRYSLLTTNENSVFIFDKKSTILNKCDAKGCSVIETKLPTKMDMVFTPTFQQSKMFDTNPPMTKAVNEKMPENKIPEKQTPETTAPRSDTKKNATSSQNSSPSVEAKPATNETTASKAVDAKPATNETTTSKAVDTKSENATSSEEKEKDDEFVE